jgi:ubiquinone biosynthesis protein
MNRTSIDKVRESVRLQQVYNVFLRYGWDGAIQSLGPVNTFRRKLQKWIWDLPEEALDIPAPVKMRLMIEELGPTYVKMGQIVSSQSNVLPKEWAVELDKLQSNVPPFPSEEAREVIREELGDYPENLFASFNPTPFAAASTAQVHLARLHTGEKVVVKVQRPNIHQQMKADLGIMQNAARIISARSSYVRTIDLVGMLEQFSSSVLDELDYLGEAYNATRLGKDMAPLPGVTVPKIYYEFTTSKVLTMDFVDGVKITNVDAIEAAGFDKEVLVTNLLRAMVKQLFITGFFHADPHPGNVFVNLETGNVTFIDMGMVGELTVQQRLNIAQLLMALQKQDIRAMADILLSLSTPFMDSFDQGAYYRDFERTVGRFMLSGNISIGQSVSAMFELLRKHGLRLDPDLTMAIKALTQVESIANILFTGGGIINQSTELMKELAVQEVTPEKVQKVATDQAMIALREVMKNIPDLTTATTSWINQYKKGKFEVHLDFSEMNQSVESLNRLGRLAVIGIMLVGMIIGSAIAASAIGLAKPTGDYWDLMLKFAYFGYILAMGIATIVSVVLLWRWIRNKPPKG